MTTPTTPTKLKPCPFCGSDDLHIEGNGENNMWIVCEKCGTEGPITSGYETAHNKWNTRHAEQPQTELNEARKIASEACAMLAENGFETNYPPMPWDSDSPENDKGPHPAQLPPGIPQPPDGFVWFGNGPVLRGIPVIASHDIAFYDQYESAWSIWASGLRRQTLYALRAGSEIARLNGLS